jgi:hypothetical protein
MSSFGALAPMNDPATIAMPSSEKDQALVSRLIGLAVRGLGPMLDQDHQLFCYKLKKSEQGMMREGLSQRYTMMTLLGLQRLEKSGAGRPFNTERILRVLLSDLAWIDNIGDLGVLLWLCSTVCPERLSELEPRLQVESALERYRGAKDNVTMELAWFLTGICYWGVACPEKLVLLKPIAFESYRKLTKNQGERGFFAHLASSGSLAGMIRGRIGSFADQVYPIYAFTQFFHAYKSEDAAKRALKCAMGICEAQGPWGQWWWHYDSERGQVANGYPVFSVHQHAMAPMTLFALGDAIGYDFDPWIYNGLRWINSHNEFNFDMEDASAGVIWRCIQRTRPSVTRYLCAKLGRQLRPIQQEERGAVEVLFECRPYELGWLLYAFTNRFQLKDMKLPFVNQ